MDDELVQAFNDLIDGPVPTDARLFGGTVDAAAELMDGSRVPSSPTFVYLSNASDAEPVNEVYVYDPDNYLWSLAADSQVFSDDRGILQIFAIPDDPYQVWVDFGAGKTGITPNDTHHVLKKHLADSDAHQDIRQRMEALKAEIDSLDGQVADIEDLQMQMSDVTERANQALSHAAAAETSAGISASRVSALDDRVNVLETDKPCLRLPVMWDMSGELGTNVSKHRYTNLHSHEQEVTMFYAEVDHFIGEATVRLLERNPSNGNTTVIATGQVSESSKTFRTEGFSHVLGIDRQIVPELVMADGAIGRDLTVEVYLQ